MSQNLASRSEHQQLPALGFLLLASLSLFWGLNWPSMKTVLSELPVWWFRTSCVLIGGGALLTISALSGNRVMIRAREIGPIGLCALFNIGGWHLCSGYGISLMPAGRASIIAFTMPLWAALFSSLLLGERFNLGKAIGLMLGPAVTWALGTVLFKRGTWSIPVASHIGWQLLMMAAPFIIGAALLEPFPDLGAISQRATFALIYIYAFPMTYCQWAYFKVVHLFPASIAAIGTLMVPVVGVYSSGLLLGESIGLRELAALALICSALASVLVVPGFRRMRLDAGMQ